MATINIRKNINTYLIASALITISYSLPHSILTVLLISKGISLSQILVIQSAYSLAMILFEFPSGVVADMYSKKNVYILSKLLLIILYIVVICSDNFLILYFAWFLYGLASALDSGTIDADLYNQIKCSNEFELSNFIAVDGRISTVSLLVGSTIGGLCYLYFGTGIYFLSVIFCSLAIGITQLFYKESNIQKKEKNLRFDNFTKHVVKSLEELKNSKIMQIVIILDFLTQIFFQTHFQLWQAFLIEKEMSSNFFSLFYVVFQLIALVSYSIDLSNAKNLVNSNLYITLFGFVPLFFLSNSEYIYIPAYIMFIFLFYIIQFILKKYYTHLLSTNNISSLISFKGTLNRIGSMITLFLLSFFCKFHSCHEFNCF